MCSKASWSRHWLDIYVFVINCESQWEETVISFCFQKVSFCFTKEIVLDMVGKPEWNEPQSKVSFGSYICHSVHNAKINFIEYRACLCQHMNPQRWECYNIIGLRLMERHVFARLFGRLPSVQLMIGLRTKSLSVLSVQEVSHQLGNKDRRRKNFWRRIKYRDNLTYFRNSSWMNSIVNETTPDQNTENGFQTQESDSKCLQTISGIEKSILCETKWCISLCLWI